MEVRFMGGESLYREACARERTEEAEKLHKALVATDWDKLTERDRGIREALSWVLGEQDSKPRVSGAVEIPDDDESEDDED